jgi:hypothetical protein
MKLFIILSLISFSTFAQSLLWSEIDFEQELLIQQTIKFNAELEIAQKSQLVVKDIIPLDYIRVQLYQLEIKACSDTNLTSDMVIVPIVGSQVEAGFQWAQDCILEVFIENSDLNKLSPFTDIL